ncbi:hypothetical protein SAMN04488034_10389 [Salinimicrobium catena]|uniref:Uncharacterized protein n=1 Tax=Salinimicrobium catena TaxID=390640 RepID=A0A1H5MV04_9FLAO|nr:hypothetical protein [Salinimicrobium catena]SDL29092.1 hypothetical protein SAMN04488140_10389 [Salinimicrobium catena]SEE92451.1 hypothetical protein SAMN04488034_10389 [Salinimicrobium catena]
MNLKKNLLSTFYLTTIIVTFIISGIIFSLDYHRYDNHRVLDKELGIKTDIEKMKIDHGFAILNDNLIIPSGSSLKNKGQVIKNQSNLFIELDDPFTLIKNPCSLEFQVVNNYDTLIFEIPDLNFKDPTDPTIEDFIENILGE